MEDVLAVTFIFGSPIIWYVAKRYFDALAKGHLGPKTSDTKQLAALQGERDILTDRVKNLESIVCGLDGELNLRLGRLAAEQNRLSMALVVPPAALPQAASVAPVGAAPAPVAPAPQASPAAATVAALTPELAVGSMVADRYRVERLLGRGGMGAVYLAQDTTLHEPVALKVIHGWMAGDAGGAVERFKREASAARRISHSGVVRIHDLGVASGGMLYLSMEHVPGRPLSDVLAAGPMELVKARNVLGQVCDALHAAHQAGVIHRDLKPANILLTPDGVVKLIDFGLARVTVMEGMTATGLILGTPEYMAPEQVRGGIADARTDVYALGAVAFHLLSGKALFKGDTPIAVAFAHVSTPPPPLRSLVPSIPESVDAAVTQALSKEPSQRPQSALEFKRLLG